MKDSPAFPSGEGPLLPFEGPCLAGTFLQRVKRFSVALETGAETIWVHSNNSGSMLGLTRPGSPVLASRAANPKRKLHYTQEAVWLGETEGARPVEGRGFWTGVNTSVPNRMLEAAFHAGRLPFAQGYNRIAREVKRGASRLDACLAGPELPPLWVECKNVTMVEDGVACFPDAASERGRKHLLELMDIVRQGERACMFYLVQRADGGCFGPADCIDPEYARLFYEALAQGVEMHAWRARVCPEGVLLQGEIPVLEAPCRGV